MYKENVTSVYICRWNIKCAGEILSECQVVVGLHQRIGLKSLSFPLCNGWADKRTYDEVLWYILFADNIDLVEETREDLRKKLDNWRETLEMKDFKISRMKTKGLICSFVPYTQKYLVQWQSKLSKIQSVDHFAI